MDKILEYAKGLAASIGGALTAVLVGLPLIDVEVPKWLAIVSLVITSVAVIVIPNKVTDAVKAEIIDDAIRDPNVPVVLDTPSYHTGEVQLVSPATGVPNGYTPIVDVVDHQGEHVATEAEQRSGV